MGKLAKLGENLEFLAQAMADLQPQLPPPPVAVASEMVPSDEPTVYSVLCSRLHKSFSCAADDLYGYGCMDEDKRIALSACVGDAIKTFRTSCEQKAPWAFTRTLEPEIAQAVVVEENLP